MNIIYWMVRTIVVLLVIIIVMTCTGCGTTPYGRVGVAHQLDNGTDWINRTERSWQCSNPAVLLEAGIEKRNVQLSWVHQSWLTCGSPFDADKPEMYANYIYLGYKFGGE